MRRPLRVFERERLDDVVFEMRHAFIGYLGKRYEEALNSAVTGYKTIMLTIYPQSIEIRGVSNPIEQNKL